MPGNNDIEVKIGAETSGLDAGMDKAASTVRAKSDLVNQILRQKAQEAAQIAKQQADEAARQARRQAEEVERIHRQAAANMQNVADNLKSQIMGVFSLGAIISFVRSTKEAVVEAEAAFRGLEAVANYAGVGIGRAMQEAQKLAADGMMTTAEASKALQNLLSRGYSIDEAVTTLNRLKDAAAFNRSAHLEMGEAVVSATEGLKNENSILVDNAGVTKNVSVMWKEYAAEIGKGVNQLTQQEKIQAEVNGIMRETDAQTGNAAKAMQGMQGQSARLEKSMSDLKISIGEALTPAFAKLAEWGTWVINNVFVPMLKAVKILGAAFAAVAVDIGNVWDAVTNLSFKGLGAKFEANARLFKETVDDIIAETAGSSFKAGPDSGRRRTDAPATKTASSGAAKAGKKPEGPIDVFENRSFVTGDRSVADFIREQYRDVNALQAEIARDQQQTAERAARAAADADRRAAIERTQIALIRKEAAVRAELAVVDAAEEAARHQVDLGMMTREELLRQQQEFESRRHQIMLESLQAELAILEQNPETNPAAKAALLAEIEALETQHQLRMTEIKNAAELERSQYQISAMNSIQSSMASNLQQLMMGQMTLANFMRATWTSVLQAITGEIAKFVAQWIMQKIKMLVFGKTTAMSEISAASAKAGANGIASFAAAPWPINMGAPAFGAAMAAAAMAYAPMASAAGGFDIPAGVNPITQLHAKEMVLPAHLAEAVRSMAKSGGEPGNQVSVVMEINTPNADSFRASQDQILADMNLRLKSIIPGD